MRRKRLETFAEICTQIEDESPKSKRSRATGSETMPFLIKKSEADAEFKREVSDTIKL